MSPWLTNAEAAERLRMKPASFRAWRYRNPGKVKTYRVGLKRLFRVTDIDRLVQPVKKGER